MRSIKEKITWIDVFKPNEADLKALKKLHPFHPVILNELLQPSARPRSEHYRTYLFLIYHLPMYDSEAKTSRRVEIDILITKNTIITVHYDRLAQLDEFFDSLLKDPGLRKKALGGSTFLPLYYLLLEMTKFSLRQLRHIEDNLTAVADEMFKRRTTALLKKISYIKRDILDYRLIVTPQKELFTSLSEIGLPFWGADSEFYLRAMIGDNLRLSQALQNYFETINALEQTNSQLLNAETNTIIKRFTIAAFLFSVPLFFIFTLSIPYVSEHVLTSALRFWTIFLSIFIVTGVLAWAFKNKNLL